MSLQGISVQLIFLKLNFHIITHRNFEIIISRKQSGDFKSIIDNSILSIVRDYYKYL